MSIGQACVRPPQDDQLAVAQLQWVERAPGAIGHRDAGPDSRPTQRPHEPGGSEVVEEPRVEAHHREQALVAGAAVRQHGLATVRVHDSMQLRSDRRQGVVPGGRFELAGALRSAAAQGCEDALRAVHPIEKSVDLRTQLALAIRMVAVAAQLDGDAVGHGDLPPARVRAVVMTRPVDHAGVTHAPTLRAHTGPRRQGSSRAVPT